MLLLFTLFFEINLDKTATCKGINESKQVAEALYLGGRALGNVVVNKIDLALCSWAYLAKETFSQEV